MRGGTGESTIGRGGRRQRGLRIPALLLGTALFAATVVALSAPVGAAPAPDLSLAKSADVSAYPHVGTLITYTYDVTNTGTSTLTNITVTDPMVGLSAIDCGGGTNVIASLAPGASQLCTATYTTTQADQDNEYLTNTGTATVSTPAGTETATSTVMLPAVKGPAVSIEKTANVSGFSTAGTTITYSYIVTNTGYETLYSVTVTDPMPGLSAISCPSSTLAPNTSETCTATYVTTAADVEAGSITNAGTVNVVNEEGTGADATASLEIPGGGEPFTCDDPHIYLSQGSPTRLYAATEGQAVITLNALGGPYTRRYNALGYDAGNHYLYAVTTPHNLIRIDSSGTYTALGPIAGLPTAGTGDGRNVGAFDAVGNYWVMSGGTSTAYEIPNVSTPAATAVALTGSFDPADWTFSNGYLWGLSGRVMYRVGPTTATPPLAVASFPVPRVIPATGSPTFGAAWTFGNGDLGFSNNASGEIYEVSVTSPSSNPPTFSLVSTYAEPPAANNTNDGAACIGKPADLGIVKTAPATVTAGNTITWTITVTNDGPGNSSGYVVNDAVPAGVTIVSAPAGCTVTGNAVRCPEGALPNGSPAVITLSGTAPTAAPVCFANTATVFGNESDPNPKNNSSSVKTCTAKVIHLTKNADIASFTKAGVLVTYTYEVTNESVNQALVDLNLRDPMNGLSGPDCGNGTSKITELDAGATQTCTATYTTTAADVSAGLIRNTAVATGFLTNGKLLHSDKATVTIPLFGITTTALPDVTVGKPYSTTLTATGGTLPYKWTAKGLPAGLKLDAATGVISGTVKKGTKPTTFPVVIGLTDASKPRLSDTADLTLTVDPPPPN